MGLALTLFLWALGLVLAIAVAVIALPLRIELRLALGEALRYSVALRPFGGFGPRLSLADSDKQRRTPEKPKKKTPKRQKPSTGEKRRHDLRRIIPAAARGVLDVFSQFHIETAKLDVRFGAGDPAETGQIFGALTPFIYGTSCNRRLWLNVEPVFDGPVFDGQASLDVSVTPARLIAPIVRFGWAAFGPSR